MFWNKKKVDTSYITRDMLVSSASTICQCLDYPDKLDKHDLKDLCESLQHLKEDMQQLSLLSYEYSSYTFVIKECGIMTIEYNGKNDINLCF